MLISQYLELFISCNSSIYHTKKKNITYISVYICYISNNIDLTITNSNNFKYLAMKASLKIFVNSALTFAAIGFVTYLLIIISGFFGCCAGISTFLYHKIVLILVVTGAITFGICLYKNCYKSTKY